MSDGIERWCDVCGSRRIVPSPWRCEACGSRSLSMAETLNVPVNNRAPRASEVTMTDENDKPEPAPEPPAPQPRTLEEKRAFVAEHLTSQAREYRANAAADRARAEKADVYATFVEHRASIAQSLDETSIDLLLADWSAKHAMDNARRAARNTEHLTENLWTRWMRPDVIFGAKS